MANKKEKVKTKTNSNTKKYIIFTIVIIVVISLLGVCVYFITRGQSNNNEKTELKKNLSSIKGYDIHLDDNDSNLYKEEYLNLKDLLESNEIDYDEYARFIAKLFIIDLYTIDNKINKYDVGGVEFVYSEIKDNYILNVTNTLYNFVQDNSSNKRTQELPTVTSIEIKSEEKIKYEIKSEKKEYDAYKFNVSWQYNKDQGYDTNGEVIVLQKDKKMYVVEKN